MDYLISYKQHDFSSLHEMILSEETTFLEKFKVLREAYVHFDITEEQFNSLFEILTSRG